MSYTGRRILVLGLGRSGRAAVDLLLREGARVAAHDRDPAAFGDLDPRVEPHPGEPPDLDEFDLVVASPGVPVEPRDGLIPEVDLASRHLAAKLVGVTGTNGKSTVTRLVGAMLAESGIAVEAGGNLGTPLSALVGRSAAWIVAELSSFQLEHARELRAVVAVLLNLAADHLDRHGSLEAYGNAKARLAELQQPGDALVVNLDDSWARGVSERAPGRVYGFSAERALESGACLDGADLVVACAGRTLLRVPRAEIAPAARAPIANALAAATAALAAGATPQGVAGALAGFEGLPHRAALVCVRAGVRYVDDSKATNPSAAATSLHAQDAPVVWILGGRNKDLDFAPLAEAARAARAAVVFGESAGELHGLLRGKTEVVRVGALEVAVREAARLARPGDTVLLAPACASFDQFRSYEERGERFAELARSLPDAEEGTGC